MVAAEELYARRPPRMFVGFLVVSAAAGLVAVPLAWMETLDATLLPSSSISFLLIIGAIAFGLGALINQTCLLGSLVRLGDGEMRLLALPVGLAIGILAVDHGRFGHVPTWPSLIARPSVTGLVTLLAFLIVLVPAIFFVCIKTGQREKPDWSFGGSMVGLGITGGLLYVLPLAWTFADLIQRGLPLTMAPAGEIALAAAISSLAGALTASFRQGNLHFRMPTAIGILRSVAGGALMGIGIGLIPGGNDGLILAAVPTLSPGGIFAYLLMTTTIIIGLAAHGTLLRLRASRRA